LRGSEAFLRAQGGVLARARSESCARKKRFLRALDWTQRARAGLKSRWAAGPEEPAARAAHSALRQREPNERSEHGARMRKPEQGKP